jgi:hypothetical protein
VQGFMTPGSVIPSCGRYYCKAANSRGLGINSAFVESCVAEMNSVTFTVHVCILAFIHGHENCTISVVSSNQSFCILSKNTHTHTHTHKHTTEAYTNTNRACIHRKDLKRHKNYNTLFTEEEPILSASFYLIKSSRYRGPEGG